MSKLSKNYKADFKEILSSKPVGLGIVFGLMFWLVLDNIALGVALGFVMYIVFNQESKKILRE